MSDDFNPENAVAVHDSPEGTHPSDGAFNVENAVPVESSDTGHTAYDAFRTAPNASTGLLEAQQQPEDGKTASPAKDASKGPLNTTRDQPDKQSNGVTGSWPKDDFLNAVVDSAKGTSWQMLDKGVFGKKDPQKDEFYADLEKRHPIANVIGGSAPFLAASAVFPESLIPNIWGRLAIQFGGVGFLNALGKVRSEESQRSVIEKAQTVAVDTAKSAAAAPIFAKAQLLKIAERPFATALAQSGIITGGVGAMNTFFGDNVVEAFKQSGVLGVVNLAFHSPHLLKTVIGRGAAAKMSEVSGVKIDPDAAPEDVKKQINDAAEEIDKQNPKISEPKIIAATIKLPDGTEIHGTSHEDALNKLGVGKEGMKETNFPKVSLKSDEKLPANKDIINQFGESVGKISYSAEHMGEEGLSIDIKEALRGKGYGKAAIREVFDFGVQHISGDVGKENIKAQDFWNSIGGELTQTPSGNFKLNLSKENFESSHQGKYQAGFTVLDPNGDIRFVDRDKAEKEFGIRRSEDVQGLNESKFLAPSEPVKIVNPETLENMSGEYVHNEPLDISFGKNDKLTSKKIRQEFSGIKNEQIVRGNQLADKIRQLVPDKFEKVQNGVDKSGKPKYKLVNTGLLERQAIFWYKAAEGDTDLLLEMLSEKAMDSYRDQVNKAFNLSSNAMKALEMINKYYEESGKVALEIGTIRDVRENYQNRIYKPEPPKDYVKSETASGIKQTTSHAKRRVYDNEFDAIMGGKEFATTDVADALSIHNEEMARVNTARKLADTMAENKLGAWRRPDNIPDGWEQVGTLKKSVPIKDESGQAIIGQDGNQVVSHSVFVAPKGIANGLKAISEPNFVARIDFLRGLQKYQGLTKTVDLAYSFFHHLSMGAQVLYQGGVRTFIQLPHIERLIKSDSFLELEQDFAKHTGITSKVEANRDILRNLVEHSDSIYSKIENLPGVKQYLKGADAGAEFLFGKIQRYLKVSDYGQKISDWVVDHPEATNEEVKSAKVGIAKQINVVYGGLNWEAMGITRSNLALLRLGLLAPDWTLSNVALLKYAVGQDGVASQLSRKHVLVALVGGMIATEGLNHLFTGHFTDKNKKGHALEVEVSPNVYVSLLRGGIGDISKFGSMVAESGLGGVSRFAQGKLSPFARTLIGLLNNIQYTGRAIVKKGEGPVLGTYHVMAYLLGSAGPVPFGASNTSAYLSDKNTDKTFQGAFAVLSGLGRYSKSKDTTKEMTPYQERRLAKESKLDPLHKKAERMSFEKVADLYKNASDEDKPALKKIMERKMANKRRIHNVTKVDEKLYRQLEGLDE